MKKLIFSALFLIGLSAQAQLVVKANKAGNFVSIKKDKIAPKPTGRFYVDGHGRMWPVFKTASGKFFALRKSKNGIEYRSYLRTDKMTIDWEGN